MHVRALLIVMLLAPLGCGGKQVAEPSEPEPPWVTDYQRRATEGCACGDPACLDKAHADLTRMLADHGGIDDAPPSVHEAHGEFDKCWRAGTRNLGRELADAADAVCRCTEAACLERYRVDLIHIGDRYRANLDDPARLDETSQGALARGKACVTAMTVPGDEYIAILERTTKQFCECGALDCIRSVYRDRAKAFGDRLTIGDREATKIRAAKIQDRYCQCLDTAIQKGLAAKAVQPELAAKLDHAFSCAK